MDIKRRDRCGCIIENKDPYMYLDNSLTSKNGSMTQFHYLTGHLCEYCAHALEKFMNREDVQEEQEESKKGQNQEPENAIDMLIEFCNSVLANIAKSTILPPLEELKGTLYIAGEPEPEEETEDEEPKTSKFVDMVLQARSIIGNECDSNHECNSCPFYESNCKFGPICYRNHVDDFVRAFISEAANDPIVQKLVFSHYAESCAHDAYPLDQAMVRKSEKLSDRLVKDLEDRYDA